MAKRIDREDLLYPTRFTVFNPPVRSTLDRKPKSSKPIRFKRQDPEYVAYCKNIQIHGTNLVPREKKDTLKREKDEEQHKRDSTKHLFKLLDINIGSFAIIKTDDEFISKMPISVHGFVVVFKRVDADNYCAIIENISDELYASGEWNRLKEEAIAMTEEAVADEFGD